MLSYPKHGWTDFRLEGTYTYVLSYLNDIPFEWLEQAIHGLETLLPFCVKGYMEPGRFLCLVSYWNCHIVCEDEDSEIQKKEHIGHDYSNISMLEFCELLHNDIKSNLDAWADFASYDHNKSHEEKIKYLENRLQKLSELIRERKKYFSRDECFSDKKRWGFYMEFIRTIIDRRGDTFPCTADIHGIVSPHVETVCLLTKLNLMNRHH